MVDVVVGIDSPNYTPVAGDVGANLYCKVTATNSVGSANANSNTVGPVEAAAAAGGPAMTNLFLWLKADAGTFTGSDLTGPVSADASPVGGWQDFSGGNRHFTQAGTTAEKPRLRTNVLNGLPVLRFDWETLGNQWLAGPDCSALTAAEIFIIVKGNADPPGAANGVSIWFFSDLLTGSTQLYPYLTGDIYENFGRTTRPNIGNPVTPLNQFNLYNCVSAPGEWVAYLNGTELPGSATATNTVGFDAVTSIGSDGPGTGNQFGGDIAEIIMYSAKCSDPDKAATKAYLATKYALTIA